MFKILSVFILAFAGFANSGIVRVSREACCDLGEWGNAIQETVEQAGNTIKSVGSDVVDAVKESASSTWEDAKELASSTLEDAQELASSTLEDVQDGASSSLEDPKELASSVSIPALNSLEEPWKITVDEYDDFPLEALNENGLEEIRTA